MTHPADFIHPPFGTQTRTSIALITEARGGIGRAQDWRRKRDLG